MENILRFAIIRRRAKIATTITVPCPYGATSRRNNTNEAPEKIWKNKSRREKRRDFNIIGIFAYNEVIRPRFFVFSVKNDNMTTGDWNLRREWRRLNYGSIRLFASWYNPRGFYLYTTEYFLLYIYWKAARCIRASNLYNSQALWKKCFPWNARWYKSIFFLYIPFRL